MKYSIFIPENFLVDSCPPPTSSSGRLFPIVIQVEFSNTKTTREYFKLKIDPLFTWLVIRNFSSSSFSALQLLVSTFCPSNMNESGILLEK